MSQHSASFVAADASIWLFQFMRAMRNDQGEMIKNAHLLGFFRRICRSGQQQHLLIPQTFSSCLTLSVYTPFADNLLQMTLQPCLELCATSAASAHIRRTYHSCQAQAAAI
eukprot:GHUV01053010.1.p1 GENE.GHUV01053010.1~~GHUV01053010.1.p1  ORF type:complete len:111 (-),score=33.50 GHUV01053010.1:237-569(-)